MRVRIDGSLVERLLCRRLNRSRRSCCHVSRLASSFSHPPSFHILDLSALLHLHAPSTDHLHKMSDRIITCQKPGPSSKNCRAILSSRFHRLATTSVRSTY